MNKRFSLSLVSLALAGALLAGCGPSPEQIAREQAMKKLEQAGKDMEAAAQKGDLGAAMGESMKVLGALTGVAAGTAGASYDPVDFRRLKEALPVEIAGFEKEESSGAKNSAFGITVSEAKQSFKSADGKQRIRFEIVDPGTLAGPFALAHMWLNVEVDKEDSGGYEKTSTVGGRRVHEKWRNSGKHGEVQTIIGKRFLVEVDAQGIEMNEVKALISKIDVRKLEAMKEEGKKS
ncbi:MAG: hypothetical protein ACRDAM_15225 [Casimicrobium sp.]